MNGLGEHVMVFEYPVVVHREDGSVWVSCPDVPEMACAGDTSEEALFDAVDALESALSFYVDQKKAIPLPATPTEGQPVVRLPALTAAKAALWNTMVAQKISKTEMARRLGVNRPQVDRLVDLLHRSKIEQVEHALHVLGQRIELSVVAV
ncbi:type II toxin-antitoxin system HicB family antitoxin [Pseudomonas inefficax]|jgi:antitoxin HicB|uniref:type II toxin-antitoxin system HicB family antitoxin n=1 Tax=Pseudomonas inefficax TaxID=2078786 RepID=UPI00207BC2F2|nr:type II toxin-antitoxin system HicB family antitoxin [Pseudomonas inefficax]MCM8913313.1 type II toxin-antitoxin system HicB family antitoxin [Pseudomonas inefficax]